MSRIILNTKTWLLFVLLFGISFSAWQSQNGDTLLTIFIWKLGLPSSTAIAYSAIFLLVISVELSPIYAMASNGQAPIHLPQPAHLSLSITAFLSTIEMASCAQFFLHEPQPTHFFVLTFGPLDECISIFPAREPLPIPIFLSVPPKPVISCPLK